MSSNNWQKIEEIFERAVELPKAEREDYLAEACAGDEGLRREVEELISADEASNDFIEAPVLGSSTLANFLPETIEDSVAPHFLGRRIGAYQLIRELGRGGMGAVFLAKRVDDEFQKQVAIKLIKRGMDTDFILRRFRNERQILASLDHPNIGRLLDGGTTEDGLPYFVMEYIEGEPIHYYCDNQKLSIKERLALFRLVCAAVNYAHQNLIIHRDLKPGNIIVTKDGTPKLLDFGIAKILNPNFSADTLSPTLTGMRLMTPEYASPEQIRGENLTPASDIYSLGVLLYEILTGKRPYKFPSRAPHDIARVICEEEPVNPATVITDNRNLPIASSRDKKAPPTLETLSRNRRTTPEILRQELGGDLQNIVLKALRKSPEKRYASAADFSADIQSFLDGAPISAPSLSQFNTDGQLEESGAPGESLAVLPFRTLRLRISDSVDTGDYLSLGLADALITRLSHLKTISVRPTSSILRYAQQESFDPNLIGRELNVTYVLDGRIQQVGNRVRVTAQLIKIRNNETVWAGQFDEQSDDILSLQDSISAQVAHALVNRLSGEEKQQLEKRGTDNAKAYEAYLRGRFHWHTFTVEGLAKALIAFYEAIALDPNFALAYSGVADYYNFLSVIGIMSPEESFPAAKEAAQKAIELDDNLAEAHTSLAIVTFGYDWNYVEAERLFKHAIKLNPNYSEAHLWYAHLHSIRGNNDLALKEMRRAERLNPQSLTLLISYSMCLRNAHRSKEGLGKLRYALNLQPNYPTALQGFNWFVEDLKNYDEAEEACRQAVEVTDGQGLPLYAYAYTLAIIGKTEQAREILAKLEELKKERYIPAVYLALIYNALDEIDDAFKWLEQSLAERDFWMLWLPVDPRFDNLREDERYQALLRKISPFRNEDESIHQSHIETKILPLPAKTSPPPQKIEKIESQKIKETIAPAVKNRRFRIYALSGVGVLVLLIVILFAGMRLGWHFAARQQSKILPQRLTTNGADDTYPSVSPDGSRIVFSSTRDGHADIYSLAIDNPENVIRLTVNQVDDTAPSYSPDGKKIIFDRVTSPGKQSDIYVMNPDGSNQQNLTNSESYNTQAVFSPDNSRIAFASNRGNGSSENFDIYVMNADGTNVRRLTESEEYENNPSWSPDGKQIAYMRGVKDKSYEIFVMNADGTNQQDITNNPAEDELPAWSPNGKLIVFSSNRNQTNPAFQSLYVMNPDGSNVQRASNDQGTDFRAKWFADNRRLAFFSNRQGNNEIYLTDIFANSEAKVTLAGALKSIAVLPFAPDEDGELEKSLGNGLGQVLTGKLGSVHQLSVLPAQLLENRPTTVSDSLDIGRQLGVTYILRGSIHEAENSVQIFAQLVNVDDGKVLWEEKFDEQLSDLSELQNSISERVLSALTVELSAAERQQIDKRYTNNGDAYQLYLAGRYQMLNRSPESLHKAAQSFEQARQKDSNFALAYSGLAEAYLLIGLYQVPAPPDAFVKAREYALKALSIDENLPEAHASLAMVLFYDERNPAEAESHFRRAIELNSSYSRAYHWMAQVLSADGKHDEAIEAIKTAVRLEPRSPIVYAAMAQTYTYAHRYEEALSACRKALEINESFPPAYNIMRGIYEATGDYEKTIAAYQKEREYRKMTDENDPGWLMITAQTQAVGGKREAALDSLKRSLASPLVKNNPQAFSFEIAIAYALLDDREEALKWLKFSAEKGSRAFNFARVDTRLDRLHNDPRFIKLTENLQSPR